MHRRSLVVAASALALVAATLVIASSTQARERSAPDTTTPRAEPAAARTQLAERGTSAGQLALRGAGPAASAQSVCDAGAHWLRVRFTELSLYGSDTVTLTGSAGGSSTLAAKNWNGKAFYTRGLSGECVTVTPTLTDPRSRYAVDAYQSGSQPLSQASVTVAAAGDICGSACNQTDDVVSGMSPTAVITAGDNAYESGTLSEYQNNYHPTWGRFNSIAHPTPGNHEYYTSGAAGYFDYFTGQGVDVGERGKGYYSFDVGEWHFVALNSNVSRGAGSAQETWLKNDLAANTKPCTAAYWHHARFSTGSHGDDTSVGALYSALYAAKADLVIVGHDHSYERFAPARPDGTRDDTNGIRQFVIGTGGRGLYADRSSTVGPSQVFNNNTFGVGKFVLTSTGYTMDFLPVAGRTFTDHITGTCHKASTGQPDFGVTANPTAVSAAQGGNGQTTVSVGSSGGFNSAVNLTASGLPAGVTASYTPQTLTPPANGSASSTLTLSASASAAPGTYPITVTGTSGSVSRTATVQLTVTAGGSAVFSDTFETDKGWTVNPSGSDTATTGTWERGDPEQTTSTYSNQIKQLGTTVSGVNALSTGRLAGSGYGANDLDGGVTSIRSPGIGLPSTSASATFSWNVAHGDNSGPDDYLRLSVVSGGTKTKVWEQLGAASEVAGSWRTATVNLSAYAGQTVTLLFEAADAGTGSLFEAQVDDVTITGSGGTPSPSPTGSPPPPTGCAAQTNGTDVAIGDLSTVESSIAIAGCTGNASATSTVEVHIRHTYIGDLVVSLVAPDGTVYTLHNRSGSSTDNIDKTYPVNLSSEVRNGTWKLRVTDAAADDVGTIDSWTLTL
ncbi:MAG: proprotein convertase P-domain-containing protein [Micromonosporaceae bacterium]